MITTFEEARLLIKELKICTILGSSKSGLPSLWDHVDLPEKQPGESGWGEKIEAIWDWKNRLPATYPDDIFYGKVKGGFAVLMDMDYLREVHFASAYKPVHELNPLAQHIFDQIRNEPWETGALRDEVLHEYGYSKSQFDTTLKNLQISLNIARSNDPDIERDTWVTFQELYPEIWGAHILEE